MILTGKGLIVPDVHEKIVKLVRILGLYEPSVDWVLFVGDFMDRYENKGLPTQLTHDTCIWLGANLANPKYRFMYGNHDIHYAFSNSDIKCSGYKPSKQKIFSTHIKPNLLKYFHLLTWIDQVPAEQPLGGPREWLVSHAGLHPLLLHPIHGYDKDALDEMATVALEDLKFGRVHPWLQPGKSRGGFQKVGGIDWLDWNEEFEPIEGLNQIVGHTHGEIPRVKETAGSFNLCIDTGFQHVIMVDNGKIEIVEIL